MSKFVSNLISAQIAKPYNKIRKVYGLSPIKSSDEIMSKKSNLIPISKYIKERNPYWENHHILTGYWYEDEPEYIPDEKLAAFMESGDKPIILALGAMSFEDKSEREKLTMFACGSVPHSWLFKKGCFVIHHCGFGTAAATMI